MQRRGSVLVEFSLVVSFLLILLMGLFDLGRLLLDRVVITEAARVGARAGVVFPAFGLNRLSDPDPASYQGDLTDWHNLRLNAAAFAAVNYLRNAGLHLEDFTVQAGYYWPSAAADAHPSIYVSVLDTPWPIVRRALFIPERFLRECFVSSFEVSTPDTMEINRGTADGQVMTTFTLNSIDTVTCRPG